MAWPFPSRHQRRIGVQRTLSPDLMVHHPRKLVVLVAQLVSRHSCVADRLRVVVRFPAGPRVRVKTVKFCEDFCVDWDDVEMHWPGEDVEAVRRQIVVWLQLQLMSTPTGREQLDRFPTVGPRSWRGKPQYTATRRKAKAAVKKDRHDARQKREIDAAA